MSARSSTQSTYGLPLDVESIRTNGRMVACSRDPAISSRRSPGISRVGRRVELLGLFLTYSRGGPICHMAFVGRRTTDFVGARDANLWILSTTYLFYLCVEYPSHVTARAIGRAFRSERRAV